MLRDYGSTAGNPTGHLKAMLTGNHCHFPVIDGEMVRGGAQEYISVNLMGRHIVQLT